MKTRAAVQIVVVGVPALLTCIVFPFLALAADPQPPAPTDNPATQPDSAAAAVLLDQLGHQDFRAREQATRKLIEMGPPVLPMLEAKLKEPDPDPEVVHRIKIVLKHVGQFHGVVLQVHDRKRLAEFHKAIEQIADLGADSISLVFTAYQKDGASSHVGRPPSMVTHDELVGLIRFARSRGLRVLLAPIVLLTDPRGTEWRGKIVPDDPATWWAEYREYIDFVAKAAAEGGAEVLSVGSELNQLEASTDEWRDLIKFLRVHYPKLKLGYQANWDRYWKAKFWEDLDFAMISSFYTLATDENAQPTVDDLAQAWDAIQENGSVNHHKARLLEWQKTIGKPILFDEVGYCSLRGTACHPWNYCPEGPGTVDLNEQANCYKAFLKVWSEELAVGGVFFFEWTLVGGGPEDTGYTPKGKPAEQIIRSYFKAVAHPSPVSPPTRLASSRPTPAGE